MSVSHLTGFCVVSFSTLTAFAPIDQDCGFFNAFYSIAEEQHSFHFYTSFVRRERLSQTAYCVLTALRCLAVWALFPTSSVFAKFMQICLPGSVVQYKLCPYPSVVTEGGYVQGAVLAKTKSKAFLL